jgi:gluconate kinase
MSQYEANNLVQDHEDRKIMKRCKDLNRIYRTIIRKKNENSGHMYIEKYLSFVASLDKVFK